MKRYGVGALVALFGWETVAFVASVFLFAGCGGERQWCAWRVVSVERADYGNSTLLERTGHDGVRATKRGVWGEPGDTLILEDRWPHSCEVPK